MSSFDPNVHVPGLWRCAKCNFSLIQSNLNAGDGTVTARDEAGEKCPNDGAPLWRVTWKQHAFEHATDSERAFDKLGEISQASLDLIVSVQETLLTKDAILVNFPLEKISRVMDLIEPQFRPPNT